MKKLTKNRQLIFVVWIIAALILLFLALVLHKVLHHLIPNPTLRDQIFAALVGSILGAIIGSAATTGGIVYTDHLREKRSRDHERRLMHYNSIIKLQWEMNVIRASLEDNTVALNSIIEANKIGIPTFQRPIQVSTDTSHFEKLYDLKLINMLNDLYYDIRRINLDSLNLNRAQDTLADHLFTGKITSANYKSEVAIFNPHVIKLRQHILYILDHLVMDIVAYTRICADQDSSEDMKDRFSRITKDRKKITDAQMKKTRNIISLELEETELEGLVQQEEETLYE